MKTRRIAVITAVILTISSTLFIAPSYGLQLDQDFQKILTLITKIREAWGEQGQDAEDSTQDSVGDMGEPDPVAAGEDFKNKTADEESLPTAQAKGEAIQRAISKLKISQALGKEGQEETKVKVDDSLQVAQEAQNLADEAQGMDASQNILKVIANQNALIVGMLSNQRTDSLQQRYDTVHSNMLLTQVADNLAAQKANEQLINTGTTSLITELAVLTRLDHTYIEK
ncbi:hypothetical protein H6G80_30075 [Nostoc sp. FACHB-87]|uniref:hypothetical protein n=1 Tax=Nostocaceae TaxID=1162 RepID=UPI001683541B|nr:MULTISPECIES: hypothetical protein [Nostocaceae]MBD2458302.1 hypothetical protein [Nostoc sp. FACHB-87]MBD2479450.1 hypothetical protein [Anabaena sp. FACHB-83]